MYNWCSALWSSGTGGTPPVCWGDWQHVSTDQVHRTSLRRLSTVSREPPAAGCTPTWPQGWTSWPSGVLACAEDFRCSSESDMCAERSAAWHRRSRCSDTRSGSQRESEWCIEKCSAWYVLLWLNITEVCLSVQISARYCSIWYWSVCYCPHAFHPGDLTIDFMGPPIWVILT